MNDISSWIYYPLLPFWIIVTIEMSLLMLISGIVFHWDSYGKTDLRDGMHSDEAHEATMGEE